MTKTTRVELTKEDVERAIVAYLDDAPTDCCEVLIAADGTARCEWSDEDVVASLPVNPLLR